MVAYLTKTRSGYELRLCARPCNGAEYAQAEMVIVAGKREARAVCRDRGATPYNF